jgi:DNA-binding NarL/FixJ family response regulator
VPSRPRVLIADDHPGFAKALSRLLSIDCEVVGLVDDGRAVAPTAARLQPVIVVVDLNLPNVNGLDVCRDLARQPIAAWTIVVTGMNDDVVRAEALAAGAAAFFAKGAPSDELIAAINRLWSGLAR